MLTNVWTLWNEQANLWIIQSSHSSHNKKSPVETKVSCSGTPCAGKGHLAATGGMEAKHMASAELIHSLCSLQTSYLHYPKQTMRHIAQASWLYSDNDIPNMYQQEQGEGKRTLLLLAACTLDDCKYLNICRTCRYVMYIYILYFFIVFDFHIHTMNYLSHTIQVLSIQLLYSFKLFKVSDKQL